MKYFNDPVGHALNLLQLLYLKKDAKWTSGDLARIMRCSPVECRMVGAMLEKVGYLTFPYSITPGTENRKLGDLIAVLDKREQHNTVNGASASSRAFSTLQDAAMGTKLKTLFEGHKPDFSFKMGDVA